MHYKDRKLEDGISANLADTINYKDYTSLRMQFRSSLGSDDQSQNSGRRRRNKVIH
jgi:hypothetical protein